jgi:hypothetical protein
VGIAAGQFGALVAVDAGESRPFAGVGEQIGDRREEGKREAATGMVGLGRSHGEGKFGSGVGESCGRKMNRTLNRGTCLGVG